jgi:hypothetical protein
MKNILKTSTDDDLVAETLIKTENEHYDFKNEDVIDQNVNDVEEQTAKEEMPEMPFPEVSGEEENQEEPSWMSEA